MRKIALILFTLFWLTPSFTQAQTTAQPWDVHASYAKDEILSLHTWGIVSGYTDGTFKPKQSITRAEFAVILGKALKLEESPEAADVFTDVPTWAKGYVGALMEAGYTYGMSPTEFGSEYSITREQMASIFIRVFEVELLLEELEFSTSFADESLMSNWAKPYIQMAKAIGFIQGDGVNFFPQEKAQRQAAAKLIYQLIDDPLEYLSRIYTVYIEAHDFDVDRLVYLNDEVTVKVFSPEGDFIFFDSETGKLFQLEMFEVPSSEWMLLSEEDKISYLGEMVSHWRETGEAENAKGPFNLWETARELDAFFAEGNTFDGELYLLLVDILESNGSMIFL